MADVAVNFHDGPLPAYAGLNVTSWALLNDQREHAVTWHLIGPGIDDGDVVLTEWFPIEPSETAYSLNARCYEAALRTFPRVAHALASEQLTARPQAVGPYDCLRDRVGPETADGTSGEDGVDHIEALRGVFAPCHELLPPPFNDCSFA